MTPVKIKHRCRPKKTTVATPSNSKLTKDSNQKHVIKKTVTKRIAIITCAAVKTKTSHKQTHRILTSHTIDRSHSKQ